MITSHTTFMYLVSAVTLIGATSWTVWDILQLRKALAMRRRGEDAHDRIFGAFIGLCVAAIGFIGVIKYHLG